MKRFVERLTVEELNLMAIYDTSSREILLNDLLTARRDVYDSEMLDIFDSAIKKLETLDESEFEDVKFFVDDDIF